MRRLLIVGAGGFGREVLGWARSVNSTRDCWDEYAFLDANPGALAEFPGLPPIIGDPASFVPSGNDELVCAIAAPAVKLGVCRSLQSRGARFVTLVHPAATVGGSSRLGVGCVLCPGAVVTADASLADFVMLNIQATVGHDATLGAGCTLNVHCDVAGFAKLGEGVFMGSHAVVLPRVVVGDYAVVGAGSVVLRKVPPHTTVMGVPAKRVYIAPAEGGNAGA